MCQTHCSPRLFAMPQAPGPASRTVPSGDAVTEAPVLLRAPALPARLGHLADAQLLLSQKKRRLYCVNSRTPKPLSGKP